jgi:Fur family ferric uptake transcriptional regulator
LREVIVTAGKGTAGEGLENEQFQRVMRGQEQILEMLRKRGFRVTRQRRLILDVIFENDCTSCKEIYYRAARKDSSIGMATVYRMVNTLTDLGVLKVAALKPEMEQGPGKGCLIRLRSRQVVELDEKEWLSMLTETLRRKGADCSKGIAEVVIK